MQIKTHITKEKHGYKGGYFVQQGAFKFFAVSPIIRHRLNDARQDSELLMREARIANLVRESE